MAPGSRRRLLGNVAGVSSPASYSKIFCIKTYLTSNLVLYSARQVGSALYSAWLELKSVSFDARPTSLSDALSSVRCHTSRQQIYCTLYLQGHPAEPTQPWFAGSLLRRRRRRAWLGTGRRVENSRGSRCMALGMSDVLLQHHVLGICPKNRCKCHEFKDNIQVLLINVASDLESQPNRRPCRRRPPSLDRQSYKRVADLEGCTTPCETRHSLLVSELLQLESRPNHRP
jgi:hypothetical protein